MVADSLVNAQYTDGIVMEWFARVIENDHLTQKKFLRQTAGLKRIYKGVDSTLYYLNRRRAFP